MNARIFAIAGLLLFAFFILSCQQTLATEN
jgi:hypothetical protein